MARYTVKLGGDFHSVGPSNPRFGICGKSWRVGLGIGPIDPSLYCGKE